VPNPLFAQQYVSSLAKDSFSLSSPAKQCISLVSLFVLPIGMMLNDLAK